MRSRLRRTCRGWSDATNAGKLILGDLVGEGAPTTSLSCDRTARPARSPSPAVSGGGGLWSGERRRPAGPFPAFSPVDDVRGRHAPCSRATFVFTSCGQRAGTPATPIRMVLHRSAHGNKSSLRGRSACPAMHRPALPRRQSSSWLPPTARPRRGLGAGTRRPAPGRRRRFLSRRRRARSSIAAGRRWSAIRAGMSGRTTSDRTEKLPGRLVVLLRGTAASQRCHSRTLRGPLRHLHLQQRGERLRHVRGAGRDRRRAGARCPVASA